MRINIAAKILAGFLVVIMLLGVVTVISLIGLKSITSTYQDLTDRTDQMLVEGRRLEASSYATSRAAFGYLLTKDHTFKTDAETAAREGVDALAQLKSMAREPEALLAIEKAEKANRTFHAAADAIYLESNLTPERIQELATRTLPQARAELVVAIQELSTFLTKYNESQKVTADSNATLQRVTIIAIAVVAAIAGILAGLISARLISRPVIAVAKVARRLSDGDLTVETLKVKNRDEVGDMAGAINQMVLNLREVLGQISLASQTVMAASEELSASAESSAQAAEGAAQGVAQVTAGATEQSQSTQVVSATSEQLQLAIQQVASGAAKSAGELQAVSASFAEMVTALEGMVGEAQTAATQADQAAEKAQDGAEVVQQTLSEMEQIKAVVVATSATIDGLAALSAQIGTITGTISDIAEQTNLLALNAAIEAARAGDHGRGFAVVADEVRKLAERSAASTKEITLLVSSIQGRTVEAVEAMNAGTERVKKGALLAAAAGKSLQEILSAARMEAQNMGEVAAMAARVRQDASQVADAFESVAAITEENTAATEEMAAGVTEVTNAVQRIAIISQENAGATQEVSASVEEVTASSEEVASSAQGLARTAQDLQTQVARFQLG